MMFSFVSLSPRIWTKVCLTFLFSFDPSQSINKFCQLSFKIYFQDLCYWQDNSISSAKTKLLACFSSCCCLSASLLASHSTSSLHHTIQLHTCDSRAISICQKHSFMQQAPVEYLIYARLWDGEVIFFLSFQLDIKYLENQCHILPHSLSNSCRQYWRIISSRAIQTQAISYHFSTWITLGKPQFVVLPQCLMS
jgi:hypothetical protein